MLRWVFVFWVTTLCANFSQTISHSFEGNSWEEANLRSFDELIVSWNGLRPEKGKWSFWVSLGRKGEWSPPLLYAEWSADSQRTFHSTDSFVETFQDGIYPKEGVCDAFRIEIVAEEGADLSGLKTLFATVSNLKEYALVDPGPLSSVFLSNVPLQSQIVLNHPRPRSLCSPTSTTTAINYLLKRPVVDPTQFAEQIRDRGFDIYGNWILNTAQAYCELQGNYPCHVERLNDFSELHKHLLQQIPVVVSVRGSLPGAPQPYNEGHLVCVIGYDAKERSVRCIDPAFPTSDQTEVSYPLSDFLNAWAGRSNIAYVFN